MGYAFMAKIIPFKYTCTEEEKYVNRKMLAQTMKDRHYRAWKEYKSANKWDADRDAIWTQRAIYLVNHQPFLLKLSSNK
ncbi:hypothetical protein Hanom_Chr06g00516491 [Helianthus anomalus]